VWLACKCIQVNKNMPFLCAILPQSLSKKKVSTSTDTWFHNSKNTYALHGKKKSNDTMCKFIWWWFYTWENLKNS
jgi:hypothetical protein